MVQALDVGGTEFDYVLKEDRDKPPEEQTTFHLRRLKYSELEKAERKQQALRAEEDTFVSQGFQFKFGSIILGFALQGWSNFKDREGHEVPFERDSNSSLNHRMLERIVPWVGELCNAVLESSQVTQEEAKN